jgi:hypothetical protein
MVLIVAWEREGVKKIPTLSSPNKLADYTKNELYLLCILKSKKSKDVLNLLPS